jgi:GNAT superfamily N-acetyltransferase
MTPQSSRGDLILTTSLTIYELPSTLFERCKPLYAQAAFDVPAYDAVFEGRQPGRLFVDNAATPTAAIMCRTYDYFVAGSPDTPLRTFIKDAPEEAGVFQSLYSYVPLNEHWGQALQADVNLLVIPRRNFHWDMRQPAPDFPLPEGARIEQVNVENAKAVDAALPLPFMRMFWGSYAALYENGFAYYAAQGKAVTSVVYAIAMSSTGVIVGVDTFEPFRRQGYGAAVSATFIRAALARGVQPIWDCDAANPPSAAMAERLGFVEHEPFMELRPPEWKLPMTKGVWSRGATRADGVMEWRRG